jgi:hypothetical protein
MQGLMSMKFTCNVFGTELSTSLRWAWRQVKSELCLIRMTDSYDTLGFILISPWTDVGRNVILGTVSFKLHDVYERKIMVVI